MSVRTEAQKRADRKYYLKHKRGLGDKQIVAMAKATKCMTCGVEGRTLQLHEGAEGKKFLICTSCVYLVRLLAKREPEVVAKLVERAVHFRKADSPPEETTER